MGGGDEVIGSNELDFKRKSGNKSDTNLLEGSVLPISAEIELETKSVGDIKENFFVPSYQRGYRWRSNEVERLLNDIYSTKEGTGYCLQPLVLKNLGDNKYELIDGQQRLTTIYLIYRFMNKEDKSKPAPEFSISYETREGSEKFLKSMDEDDKNKNIDYWFLWNAYKTIEKWFSDKEQFPKDNKQIRIDKVYNRLKDDVKFIWYEVGHSEDPKGVFTRLNSGKIPLTNAELVKAMFLSRDSNEQFIAERAQEIALQWDMMEKELHSESMWYFLTDSVNDKYQTRIDLLLELIVNESNKIKPNNTKEKYYTFFEIYEKIHAEEPNPKKLDDVWRNIYNAFLELKSWYQDHELYHQIGYLIASEQEGYHIASGQTNLQNIFNESRERNKSDFNEFLNKSIKESIKIEGGKKLKNLKYGEDDKMIRRLLLLFNIESVRQTDDHSQWFPFDKYKFDKGSKVNWSLEHIHAQHSEPLKNHKDKIDWLEYHKKPLKRQKEPGRSDEDLENLIDSTENMIAELKNEKSIDDQEFIKLQDKIVERLSDGDSGDYMHSISNMALLRSDHNSALSNSVFSVKRGKIAEMMQKGKFIPFCTKMVFLKYYSLDKKTQLELWENADRIAYIKAINEVLDGYLDDPIDLGEGKD